MKCLAMRHKLSECVVFVCDENEDAIIKCIYACHLMKVDPSEFEIGTIDTPISFFISHNIWKLEKSASMHISIETINHIYKSSFGGKWEDLPDISFNEYQSVIKSLRDDEIIASMIKSNSDIF